MTKITVGMLTYNRYDTLPKAIQSIRQQSLTDWELIIVNNGSTDSRVAQYCQAAVEQDSRLQYYEVYPNHIPAAYQTILDHASGQYYTQMDDDDYCEPDMLDFLYQLIEAHQADIALCGSYRVIGGQAIERFAFDEVMVMDKVQALNALMDRQICSTAVWSKLFRREKVIGRLSWSAHHKQGDADTVYKWFAKADKVVAHGVPKYYQVRPESDDLQGYIGAHNLTPQLLDDYLEIFRDRTHYLTQYVPQTSKRAQCAEWAFMLSMCEKISALHQEQSCQKQYDHMLQTILTHQEAISQCSYLTKRERQILGQIQEAANIAKPQQT